MTVERFSILIADDHPMILDGLIAMINTERRLAFIAAALNGQQAIDLFRELRPDIVLVDLCMPACGGVEAIEQIRLIDPTACIVIMTSFAGEEDIVLGLCAGASAYVLKDAPREQVVSCILHAAQGKKSPPVRVSAKRMNRMDGFALSMRELEILRLMAVGKSNKHIGLAASVTEGTVKYHVKNILAKLSVSNRTEAVNVAIRRGLVKLDGPWPVSDDLTDYQHKEAASRLGLRPASLAPSALTAPGADLGGGTS